MKKISKINSNRKNYFIYEGKNIKNNAPRSVDSKWYILFSPASFSKIHSTGFVEQLWLFSSIYWNRHNFTWDTPWITVDTLSRMEPECIRNWFSSLFFSSICFEIKIVTKISWNCRLFCARNYIISMSGSYKSSNCRIARMISIRWWDIECGILFDVWVFDCLKNLRWPRYHF